jgi:hypothetical protein
VQRPVVDGVDETFMALHAGDPRDEVLMMLEGARRIGLRAEPEDPRARSEEGREHDDRQPKSSLRRHRVLS